MQEKFTLTTDADGRLCITAEWTDGDDIRTAAGMDRHVETVPIAEIHPSRLTHTVMKLTLWEAKHKRPFAEEAKKPFDWDEYHKLQAEKFNRVSNG